MLARVKAPIGPLRKACAAASAAAEAAAPSAGRAADISGSSVGMSITPLRRGRGGRAELLVVSGERCNFLIVGQLGEERHRRRTVAAKAALPHLQFERRGGRKLAREEGTGRRL